MPYCHPYSLLETLVLWWSYHEMQGIFGTEKIHGRQNAVFHWIAEIYHHFEFENLLVQEL